MQRLNYYFFTVIVFAALSVNVTAGNYHKYQMNENDDYKPESIFNDTDNFEFKSPDCSHSKSFKKFKGQIQLETKGNRSYNVLNYDIYFDWYSILSQVVAVDTTDDGIEIRSLSRFWNGKNSIKLVITDDNVKKLDFDADSLEITGLSIDGSPLEEIPQPDLNSILTVELLNSAKKGDTINLVIDYRYISKTERGGFYLYPEGMFVDSSWYYIDSLGKRVAYYVEERLAYTMSEPQDARKWMPCNDDPNDKVLATIAIRVPVGFKTASNGLLVDSLFEDFKATYVWSHKYPITTYLIHAAASKFVEFGEWYKKVSNPSDSIPLVYFAWKLDYDNEKIDFGNPNARYMLKTTKSQMETYSTVFGEYPYEKYGIVPVFPFQFGGMEHQTITTVHRSWFLPFGDGGYAHELAHQWLGDLVTCETWKDIWINEGGASWAEALWAEKNYASGYYNTIQSKRRSYLYTRYGFGGGLNEPPIYDIPINVLFNGPTTYQKASWVYHMLMELIGREKFFPIFRKMLKQYSFDNLTTDEFREFFEAQNLNLPISLDTYFDQWLIKRGHPIYFITSQAEQVGDSDYEVKVQIKQIQEGDNIPEVFIMPVDLLFYKDSIVKATATLLNNERIQEFTANLPFIPDSVRIDSNKVLLQHAESITSVKESRFPVTDITIYPNPILENGTGTIEMPVQTFSGIEIQLFDINGRLVENVYKGMLGTGSYTFSFNTSAMNSGVYLARIRVNNSFVNRTFSVNK